MFRQVHAPAEHDFKKILIAIGGKKPHFFITMIPAPGFPGAGNFLFDNFFPMGYNTLNFIGQFVTILSVNKTRDFPDGRSMRSFFCGRILPKTDLRSNVTMTKNVRYLTHAAIIAVLYAVLTHLQNILVPGSATWMIQMRMSEALCVLAFFTPAAVPGLTMGCLVFNITYAAALPLDFVVGSAATLIAAQAMWMTRNVTIHGYPLLGMLMPAVTNAVLVGWELSVYIGGGFPLNAFYVALGEMAVLLVLGSVVYYAMKKRHLDQVLFTA